MNTERRSPDKKKDDLKANTKKNEDLVSIAPSVNKSEVIKIDLSEAGEQLPEKFSCQNEEISL